MIKIYGSMLCPDCVKCREDLDAWQIPYEYLDFSESLLNLKEFLALRDQKACFVPIRAEGKIGIPCLVLEDGTLSFDWQQLKK